MRSTLVLNNAYQPLGVIDETEAICLIVQDKATVKADDPSRPYRAKYVTINAPTIVILNHYVEPVGFKVKPEPLRNNNLFRRDGYKCQYCARHRKDLNINEKLTMDHIIPLSRGGTHEWKNVITACSTCNHMKGSSLLQEIGFKVPKPSVPVNWTIRGKSKMTPEQLEFAERMLRKK